MSIQVLPILAFKDNYIWCLIHTETKHCIIVDPGEAKPVLIQLKHLNLTLDALLITHHHWDHTNGIRSILQLYPVPVFGPAKEKIGGITHPVDEGDKVELTNWPISFEVLAIPGHTLGHIAYYGNNLLFCGDTLFTGGCGRLFEGTPKQMLDSLNRLAQLPDETLVYCGHEYTLANLHFAQAVEPNNLHVKERLEKTRELRQKNLVLPSCLREERLSNPFLRCDQPEIAIRVEKRTGKKFATIVEIFAYLRQWKNNFK